MLHRSAFTEIHRWGIVHGDEIRRGRRRPVSASSRSSSRARGAAEAGGAPPGAVAVRRKGARTELLRGRRGPDPLAPSRLQLPRGLSLVGARHHLLSQSRQVSLLAFISASYFAFCASAVFRCCNMVAFFLSARSCGSSFRWLSRTRPSPLSLPPPPPPRRRPARRRVQTQQRETPLPPE